MDPLQFFANIPKRLGFNTQATTQQLEKLVSPITYVMQRPDVKGAMQDLKNSVSYQRSVQNLQQFKRSALDTLGPRTLAIAIGAILGGGAATTYNFHINKKRGKEYQRAPQLKYFSNLSRVYAGGALGALAGLLIHKYRNKLHQTATNWFLNNKKYM